MRKIEHIIPASPILSKEKYVKRCNKLYAELHMQGSMGQLLNEHWYEHLA
jgi:hypothetical protein